MYLQSVLKFKRSHVGLLERDSGAFAPQKGSAAAIRHAGLRVSYPIDYVPATPETTVYPFIDIYAYPARKSKLERAFENTRIPPDGVVIPDVSGHQMRRRYYKTRRKTGFFLALVPAVLLIAALIVCFA